jgi:hypothetical protein
MCAWIRKTFVFRFNRFMRHHQFLIHVNTSLDDPLVKSGRKQDGYFIRTRVLGQAVLNSPAGVLPAQRIQGLSP